MFKLIALPYQMVMPIMDVQEALSQVVTFIFTDIHGEQAKLENIMKFTGFLDKPEATAWFLGDYVDKGPDSSRTLKYIKALKRRCGSRVNILGGNHEVNFMRRIYDLAWSVSVTRTESGDIEDMNRVDWLDGADHAESVSRRITHEFVRGRMLASGYDMANKIFLMHAGLDLDIVPYIAKTEPSVLSDGLINFSALSRYFNETIQEAARQEEAISTLQNEIATPDSNEALLVQLEEKIARLEEFYENQPLFWFKKEIDGKTICGPFWKNAAALFDQYSDRQEEKNALFGDVRSVVGHSVVPYFDKWKGWDVEGIISTPDGSFVVMDGGMADCFSGNMVFMGITRTGDLIGFVKATDDFSVDDWYCARIERKPKGS